MNGAGLFLLFMIVAWPALLFGVVHLRKKVSIWLWLEEQWEERKRLLSLGKRKRKEPDPRQVLLFPELKRPKAPDDEAKVKVWM